MNINSINQYLQPLESVLDENLGKKAPAMPAGLKEFLVSVAPFLAILSVVMVGLALFTTVAAIGLVGSLLPVGVAGAVALPQIILSLVVAVPLLVLTVMAIPGLFARQEKAWRFMFWSQLLSLVYQIAQFELISAAVGGIIGFYILFQLKSYYK